MWFSDDSLRKNKKYYLEMINSNTDDSVELKLFYGKELFELLFKRLDIWNELISHLKQNKLERSKEILSVPDFDTSKQIRKALKKIKQNNPKLIEKLLSDNNDYKELKDELFSSGKNLKGL